MISKKNKEAINDAIADEGIEYTFIHATSFSEIKDEKFHKERLEFISAHNKLTIYLQSIGIEI